MGHIINEIVFDFRKLFLPDNGGDGEIKCRNY